MRALWILVLLAAAFRAAGQDEPKQAWQKMAAAYADSRRYALDAIVVVKSTDGVDTTEYRIVFNGDGGCYTELYDQEVVVDRGYTLVVDTLDKSIVLSANVQPSGIPGAMPFLADSVLRHFELMPGRSSEGWPCLRFVSKREQGMEYLLWYDPTSYRIAKYTQSFYQIDGSTLQKRPVKVEGRYRYSDLRSDDPRWHLGFYVTQKQDDSFEPTLHFKDFSLTHLSSHISK